MLRNGIDLTSFFAAVNQCKGAVFFLSGQGDRMDLKSVLCQYILASVYLQQGMEAEGRIECELPEDASALKPFLEI
ncbi:MAG: hypothetical protein NC306_14200 [Butyrivibrio sp.]|nr:hypothetical protein [Butyrivibrio sp.]